MAIDRRAFLAGLTRGPLSAAVRPSAPSSTREAIRRRYFPNLALVTHENKTVRFYDDLIKGKIVTINFIEALCKDGSCPLITANLARVQGLLGSRAGRDIFMYSITLNPKTETPAVLKWYANIFSGGPGWLFLTGRPGDIELLRRKLGFVYPDPLVDRIKSRHTGTLRYGNEPLQLWGACPARAKPEYIVKTISWVDRPKSRDAKS